MEEVVFVVSVIVIKKVVFPVLAKGLSTAQRERRE
jgi:hypothetical protein